MSDTTWPDGPYLMTHPNEDDTIGMVVAETDVAPAWVHPLDGYSDSVETYRAKGWQFTPLVPATQPEEPTLEEMLEELQAKTEYFGLGWRHGNWGVTWQWRGRYGWDAYGTHVDDTPEAAVRAAWQSVCGKEEQAK